MSFLCPFENNCTCYAGVPDRDADQGLHRGSARAGVARGAGGRRRAARRLVTPGRLVPVLPRQALSDSPARSGPSTATEPHATRDSTTSISTITISNFKNSIDSTI